MSKEELNAFMLDMATMKNAIANVRANGIESNGGRIEVDKSLLDAMDKVLAETEAQLNGAKEVSVKRTREAFLNEVLDNILPKNVPGFSGTSSTTTVFELRAVTGNLIATLKAFAQGKMPMAEYDKAVDACIAQFKKPGLIGLEYILTQTGYDPQVAKNVAKTVSGLHFIKAQFKELMISTSQLLKSGGQFGFFMEKAKGSSGAGFGGKTASGGGGIPPNELHKITDPGERTKIMADPVKKRAYLDTIRSRVSSEALEATSARIDEAIAHAKKFNESGKVYGKAQWRDWNKIVAMPGVKANVTVTNVNGDKLRVEGDIEIVSDYNERKCPSFFKREFLHRMFDKPV